MNEDVKRLWVEALRSGQYPQTHGHLRDDDGYCCLGVLCDLNDPDGWSESGHASVDADDKECHEYYRATSVLPDDVIEWAGLTEEDPFVNIPCDCAGRGYKCFHDKGIRSTSVAELNDDLAWDFRQIADVIEAQL